MPTFCTHCGNEATPSAPYCPHCGTAQSTTARTGTSAPIASPTPPTTLAPTVPSGKKPVPDGIRGWSWGAFLLHWIWAIGNKTWIGLLALIPYVGIVMMIVLGIKGREWAWQNKEWDSVEHFQRVQKQWNRWAFILLGASIFLGVLLGIGFILYEGRDEYTRADTHEETLATLQSLVAEPASTPTPAPSPTPSAALASDGKYEPLYISENHIGDVFNISRYEKYMIYNNVNLLDYLFEDTDYIGYLEFEKAYQFKDNYVFIISTGENGSSCPATTYAFQLNTEASKISDKHEIEGCSEHVETYSENNALTVKKEGRPSIFYNGIVL